MTTQADSETADADERAPFRPEPAPETRHEPHTNLVPVATEPDRAQWATLPASDASVLEHMRMLQAIITRLAGNSASVKTWCIAVVSGLLALAGSSHVAAVAVVAFITVAVFGTVDAMYLAQERLYRAQFNAKAARLRAGEFSTIDLYDLSAPGISAFHVGAAIESWSIYPVYLTLLAVCLVIALVLSLTAPISH